MGTSLTGNNISQSYLGLLKTTDSQAITSSEKRLTDGAGNDTQLYLSTSSLGIGVSNPSLLLEVNGDIEVAGSITVGKGGGSITTNTVLGQNTINNSNSSGVGNVALGYHAMFANTSGSSNVAIGLTALDSNTSGGDNVVIGADAMETSTTSSFNVAIGHEALKDLNSGGHNIAIGNDAGNGITTGSQSIIIGSQADASDVTSQNEIVIGYNLSGNGSNTVTIGNSSITTNYFNGNILLGNSSKLLFGTTDVYISGTTVSDNIQLGVGGSTQFTFAQTTGLRLHQYGSGSITGTVTQRLGVTSTGQVVEIPIGAGALDGSGTAGKIAKFTDSDTLGDSILSESSSTIEISASTPILKFNNLAGGGLDPSLTATGSNFTISTSSTTPLSINLSTSVSTFDGDVIIGTNLLKKDANSNIDFDDDTTTFNPDINSLTLKSISGISLVTNTNDGGGGIFTLNTGSTGTELLRVTTGGSVGIGASPTAKLEIAGGSLASGTVTNLGISSALTTGRTRAYDSGSLASISTRGDSSSVELVAGSSAGYYSGIGLTSRDATTVGGTVIFYTHGSERARIDSSGGVIFKGALASHQTNAGAIEYFSNQTSFKTYGATSGSGFFTFHTGGGGGSAGSERARITSNGRIGISTQTPVSLLDLSNGNTQGDGISFGSNLSEIRRGNSGANLQMSHFGNVSIIIDSDGNDSSRFFNVMHGNNDSASATELFRVQENGDVNIATDSATSSGKLTIQSQGANGSDETALVLRNYSASPFTGFVTTEFEIGTVNIAELSARRIDSNNGELIFRTKQSGTISETMRLDASGLLAIGTSSAQGKVHISSTSTQLVLETPNTTNDIDFRFRENGSNKWNLRYQNSSNALEFLNQTSASTLFQLSFLADGSSTFGGKVGIGGTPSEDLHITGDTPVIRFTDSDTSRDAQIVSIDGNLRFDTDNNAQQADTNISFRTDGVQRMAIESGVVTVNQADPDAPLQVRQTRDTNGNMRTNGTYAFIAEGNDSGAVGEGIGIHLTGKRTNGSATRGVSLLSLIQNTGNAHDLVIATSDVSASPAERARVTDVGDFIVGKSTIAVTSTGVEARASGLFVATRNAGTAGIFNREGTTKGNIVDIRQDNSPVLTFGTTGDNVFLSGTANSNDLLLRTNAQNRIRILDYGLTKFDTYGLVTTTPEARMHQHQIFTMSCTSATSTTAKAMVNVGTTNAFDYTIIARIDATNIGSTSGRTATANGTNSGFFDRQAFNGNVTAITPTYNASSDTLDVAVTYSGSTAPTVSITLNGVSDVDMSRTGGCST